MEVKSFSSSYREESKALSDYKLAQGYRGDLAEAGIEPKSVLHERYLCYFSVNLVN